MPGLSKHQGPDENWQLDARGENDCQSMLFLCKKPEAEVIQREKQEGILPVVSAVAPFLLVVQL